MSGDAEHATADPDGVLEGSEAHLLEWSLGSVSETAEGDPPHATARGPFQAVAELLRARRDGAPARALLRPLDSNEDRG